MKTRTYLLLALSIVGVFLLGLLIFMILTTWRAIDTDKVPVEVTVTNESLIGFNVGTDKLYFGTVSDGGHSSRLTHFITAEDAFVNILVFGDVEGWVQVSENNFFLTAGETRDLHFRITPPKDTLPGNYTGTVVVEYVRPWPWQ